jgi:hypothetical protein
MLYGNKELEGAVVFLLIAVAEKLLRCKHLLFGGDRIQLIVRLLTKIYPKTR